eukprot:1009602-Rhodomonas_salina.1
MHKTDLESGEFMDETEAAQLAASTQPAQQEESQDGGAEKAGGFLDELVGPLTEILASLKEPLQDTTTGTVCITNHQLRKRVRDLEATGLQLGTDLDD